MKGKAGEGSTGQDGRAGREEPSAFYKKHVAIFGLHQVIDSEVREWLQEATPRIPDARCSVEHTTAVLTILATSRKAYQGIACLCYAGLGTEALALVRKIFEAHCNAKYISLNPEDRSALYNLLPTICSLASAQKIWELRGKKVDTPHYDPQSENDISRSVDELISLVGRYCGKGDLTFEDFQWIARRWTGKSLYTMIQAIDEAGSAITGRSGLPLSIRYEAEYRPLCEFTHGTGANQASFVTKEESSTVFDLRRSDLLVPEAMIMGTKYLLWLLHDVAQCFEGELGWSLYRIKERAEKSNDNLADCQGMRVELS